MAFEVLSSQPHQNDTVSIVNKFKLRLSTNSETNGAKQPSVRARNTGAVGSLVRRGPLSQGKMDLGQLVVCKPCPLIQLPAVPTIPTAHEIAKRCPTFQIIRPSSQERRVTRSLRPFENLLDAKDGLHRLRTIERRHFNSDHSTLQHANQETSF